MPPTQMFQEKGCKEAEHLCTDADTAQGSEHSLLDWLPSGIPHRRGIVPESCKCLRSAVCILGERGQGTCLALMASVDYAARLGSVSLSLSGGLLINAAELSER